MIVLFDKWRMPKGQSWLIAIIIVPAVEKIHRCHLQKASGGFVIARCAGSNFGVFPTYCTSASR